MSGFVRLLGELFGSGEGLPMMTRLYTLLLKNAPQKTLRQDAGLRIDQKYLDCELETRCLVLSLLVLREDHPGHP